MSYEGYRQNLCSEGHKFDSVDSGYESKPLCPHCNNISIWSNAVDQTNCDEWGVILPEEWKKWIKNSEVTETCNLGHEHIISPVTYFVPHKPIRHFWDGEKYVSLKESETNDY